MSILLRFKQTQTFTKNLYSMIPHSLMMSRVELIQAALRAILNQWNTALSMIKKDLLRDQLKN